MYARDNIFLLSIDNSDTIKMRIFELSLLEFPDKML